MDAGLYVRLCSLPDTALWELLLRSTIRGGNCDCVMMPKAFIAVK